MKILNWFSSFIPAAPNTLPKEWFRAALGASLGLSLSAWISSQLFGSEITLLLLGPLAASAILLFAVSSGALAQPWSILGSYIVATLVALSTTHFFGSSFGSASIAVGVSLALMCPLRCLHPPGAAVALCLTLGETTLTDMGLMLLYPVLLNALCLLGCALFYNNLTRVRYPKSHAPLSSELHHTQDRPPEQRVGITPEDLEQALAEMGEFVDVTREDLEQIIRATEKQALRRCMGDIRAGQIMSRDVQCATPETTTKQALRLLEHHHLKTLPVLDKERQLVGIVSLIDLIGQSHLATGHKVLTRFGLGREPMLEQVMSRPVTCVDSDTHVVELIPLLSGEGLHCLPVVERGELVGIVTQTDLIAALHRDLIMHLA
ncbi:MAG: HPP family protein [Pseudomonas sp.]